MFKNLKLFGSLAGASLASAVVYLFVLLTIILALTSRAPSAELTLTNPTRITGMIVEDPVTKFMVAGEATASPDILESLINQSVIHPSHIDILINSGGGQYGPNAQKLIDFIEAEKQKGTEIRCLVDGMAASLALIYLSHCSHRYATPVSQLMWHSARVRLRDGLNQYEAEELAKVLKEMNQKVWAPLRAMIGDEEVFEAFSKAEFMWPALILAKFYPAVATVVEKPVITTE